jgi:peptidoglycan-associated lipoprotein
MPVAPEYLSFLDREIGQVMTNTELRRPVADQPTEFQRDQGQRPKEKTMPALGNFKYLFVLPTLLFALGCASSTMTAEPEPANEPVATSTAVSQRQSTPTFDPVYFDTDESALTNDARDSLSEYGKSILDHPEWGQIKIDGHCDERGTDEYNRELGELRAVSVERFLVEMGVSPERVVTRSLSEHRPAVPGHEESAWRYNRRTELQFQVLVSSSF